LGIVQVEMCLETSVNFDHPRSRNCIKFRIPLREPSQEQTLSARDLTKSTQTVQDRALARPKLLVRVPSTAPTTALSRQHTAPLQDEGDSSKARFGPRGDILKLMKAKLVMLSPDEF
jgi:hypothetical protein